MISRLKQFIENQGISVSAFEQSISASDGLIRRAIKNNTDIQSKWLVKISDNYPELNIEWLLTGKGKMNKENQFEKPDLYLQKSNVKGKHYDDQSIPLYDISAAAGLKVLFAGGKQNIVDTLRIPHISKVDGAMFLTGDSMYPLMKSGDIIVFKQIHNLNYLHLGDIYILAYEIDGDEYVVVKYVNKSEKDGHVKLVSYNDHYAPLDIPISSINTIALVKASIRYNTMQ